MLKPMHGLRPILLNAVSFKTLSVCRWHERRGVIVFRQVGAGSTHASAGVVSVVRAPQPVAKSASVPTATRATSGESVGPRRAIARPIAGCVPQLNAAFGVGGPGGFASDLPCAPPENITLPGTSTDVTGLAPGKYDFICAIHTWMESVVTVEA